MRQHSGEFSEADARELATWRAAEPEHERAWQRAQGLSNRIGLVPVEAGLQVLGRPRRADRRAGVAAIVALLVAGPVGYVAWHGTGSRGDAWVADYRTATGERRAVQLADGTRVHLNTSTAIDVVFDEAADGLRLIRLHGGEIHVETAPDKGRASPRPFIVQTPEGRLRALGTRFVVRRLGAEAGASAAVTWLTVEDGAVAVTPSAFQGEATVVRAGQQIRFERHAVAAPEDANPHASAWTNGVYFARNQRLDEVLAELGRYRHGLLRCSPSVAHLRFTGVLQLNNTDAVLAALPQSLPVSVSYRTRWWVTVGDPDGTPNDR